MTLRSLILPSEDVPSEEVIIHGSEEEPEWVEELRDRRPNLKVSLSQDRDIGVETIQLSGTDTATTTSVHVVGPNSSDSAIALATNDALNNPNDTMVVMQDAQDEGDPRAIQEGLEKTGVTVVNTAEVAVEHLLQRHT